MSEALALAVPAVRPVVLTAKQEEARALMSSSVKHVLLDGGSRSGKTWLECRQIVARALKAPKSRHAILRFKFKHVKESVGMDTLPNVLDKCFPGIDYRLNKSDWVFYFGNQSEIWLGGLDDKERTEKILGKEFATILLNECSQISWAARNLAVTRLAQKCTYDYKGRQVVLPLKMYYDCNPPSKAHWAYQVFYLHQEPESKQPLADPQMYGVVKINPKDNVANLAEDYIRELENQSGRMKRRFLEGEYGEVAPGALWTEELIDKYRTDGDEELPDLQRIVVSVDPSGASEEDNKENDEIGIAVIGLGVDGRAYMLEDLTVKGGPKKWGSVAVNGFLRHKADIIIGETNYGGEMVKFVVESAAAAESVNIKFKKITASRGKVVRAEPISALHEQGKIRFCGRFIQLEEELCAFTTTGYVGPRSPNRADAFVWGITELFPGLVKEKHVKKSQKLYFGAAGWAR